MRKFRLKQYNIPWLGAVTDSLFNALPILSIINFLSVITLLYANTYEFIHEVMPWMTFWIFVALLSIGTIIGLVLVYMFVLLPLWSFQHSQMRQEDTDTAEKLNTMKEELLEEIRNELRRDSGGDTARLQRRDDDRPDD